MPLIRSASNRARQTNIEEMIASGRRPDVAVAASYRNQRQMRARKSDPPKHRGNAMARDRKAGGEGSSHAPGHEAMGDGVRLQHANAMGRGPSGNFGVESFAEGNRAGKPHPDRGMGHEAMHDGARATPPALKVGKGSMGATAHSDHGPHHVGHGEHMQHHGHAGEWGT